MTGLNEIYVGIKDKEYIRSRIDALCKKYNERQVPDYVQKRSLLRNFCNDALILFDDCFETSLLGMTRCIRKVKGYQTEDNVDIDRVVLDMVDLLYRLKGNVETMIPIKDMPSCRKLAELSPEDIISKSKDLVKSDFVKAAVSAVLLGKKVNDVVHIEDVRKYYSDQLAQLNSEIQEKNGSISPIEHFLLDKFSAEIAYCNRALLKAGLGVTEELLALVEEGKRSIEKFEAQGRVEGVWM